MTKILSMVKADRSLDRAAFRTYWRDDYLAALLDVPGVRNGLERIVHNYVLPSSIRDDPEAEPAEWAGISEMWYADRAAADAFLASEAVERVARDHAAKLPLIAHVHCREVPMWDRGGRHDALKALAFFHARAGTTREESQRYWSTDHVVLGDRLGMALKLSKYVQNHALPDYHAKDPRFDFVGAPELWFNSLDDANSLFTDQEKVALLAEDEAKFSDRTSSPMMVLEEVVVYAGASGATR